MMSKKDRMLAGAELVLLYLWVYILCFTITSAITSRGFQIWFYAALWSVIIYAAAIYLPFVKRSKVFGRLFRNEY